MMYPKWIIGLVVLVLAAASACSRSPGAGPDAEESSSQGEQMKFTNPVYDANFPDPGVLKVDDTYYAYGTNDGVHNVPLLASADLVHWKRKGDVLPSLGSWATPGFTWAPEVLRTEAGGYVLYYTARSTDTELQCVGAAVADSPHGPFEDTSEGPLICQTDEGGSIDASPFLDSDGKVYLHWKNDGNSKGEATHLYGQRLSDDGLELTGEPVRLLANRSETWHGHVIEAPQMRAHDSKLYLFYSANAYDSDAYSVGYAQCDGPLGPCRDAQENPILSSGPGAAGPGHCSIVTGSDGESTWLLYHAWPPDAVGSDTPGRALWLDRIDWVDGKPFVDGPTDKEQPAP
ncbi:MAG: glycoside hydrolase family 43 protein [Stackebrandtia sp.]